MEQIAIVANFTGYGLEFTSPLLDIYAPWLTIGLGLIVAGVFGVRHAIKTIKGNK